MIAVPPELIEQIKFYCNNNDLGLSSMSTRDFTIIIFGNNQIPVNVIHLLAANLLITGILTGNWSDANDKAATEVEQNEERKLS